MKNVKLFEKGEKVIVKRTGSNASDLNRGSLDIRGVYGVKNWANKTFEIEGTIKSFRILENGETHLAYLLSLDGRPVGYVYDDGLELVEQNLPYWLYEIRSYSPELFEIAKKDISKFLK